MEYTDVLDRPKFDFSAHKKVVLLSKLKAYGEIVSQSNSNFSMIDESDRIFYDAALASGSILITGNIKHFPSEPFIMTPVDFLSSFF